VIRTETPADVDGIDGAVEAAFGRRDEADLVSALRADAAWIPDLSLVADVDGSIVGHIALTRAAVEGSPVLALAPLAVVPDHQRRGIGSALVWAALQRVAAGPAPTVVVLGDPGFYGRFGFRSARELGITGPFGDIDEFQALGTPATAPVGRMSYSAPFGIVDGHPPESAG
jgi:putative acetyltransferase